MPPMEIAHENAIGRDIKSELRELRREISKEDNK